MRFKPGHEKTARIAGDLDGLTVLLLLLNVGEPAEDPMACQRDEKQGEGVIQANPYRVQIDFVCMTTSTIGARGGDRRSGRRLRLRF